jgi:hypothetical protein
LLKLANTPIVTTLLTVGIFSCAAYTSTAVADILKGQVLGAGQPYREFNGHALGRKCGRADATWSGAHRS